MSILSALKSVVKSALWKLEDVLYPVEDDLYQRFMRSSQMALDLGQYGTPQQKVMAKDLAKLASKFNWQHNVVKWACDLVHNAAIAL